jgi:hypothetical protein
MVAVTAAAAVMAVATAAAVEETYSVESEVSSAGCAPAIMDAVAILAVTRDAMLVADATSPPD